MVQPRDVFAKVPGLEDELLHLGEKKAQIKFNGTGKDDIVDHLASLQSLVFVKKYQLRHPTLFMLLV